VSTLPTHLQIKLLRVLQEKSFERVGSNIPIKVDIRVIAATNVDLDNEVKKGNFREDLYYRLKVVPVKLPPLRERKEDIPLLVRHFLERHCRKCNKTIPGIKPDAMAALCDYSWPGNVRELENFIELLVVLAKDGKEISYEDLPVFPVDTKGQSVKENTNFREACKSFERHYIVGVLNKTNWNRLEAAKKMKVHRNTLLMKMKALGIKEPRFRRLK
jgi:transcriptional regulator with PAS, ATPase and Fis domain